MARNNFFDVLGVNILAANDQQVFLLCLQHRVRFPDRNPDHRVVPAVDDLPVAVRSGRL